MFSITLPDVAGAVKDGHRIAGLNRALGFVAALAAVREGDCFAGGSVRRRRAGRHRRRRVRRRRARRARRARRRRSGRRSGRRGVEGVHSDGVVMVSIFELELLIEPKHERRTHNDPQLITVSNGSGRADVDAVQHKLCVLSECRRVHVGERRRHGDAVAETGHRDVLRRGDLRAHTRLDQDGRTQLERLGTDVRRRRTRWWWRRWRRR